MKKKYLKKMIQKSISLSSFETNHHGYSLTQKEIGIFIDFTSVAFKKGEKFPDKLFRFINENKSLLESLTIPQLIQLRNHFNHSLKSLTFIVLLFECSKVFDGMRLKEFTVFAAFILDTFNNKKASIKDYQIFQNENYQYEENLVSEEITEEELKMIHERYVSLQLMQVNDLLSGLFKMAFDTNFKLLKILYESEVDATSINTELAEVGIDTDTVGIDFYETTSQILYYLRLINSQEHKMLAIQDTEGIKSQLEKIKILGAINKSAGFKELESYKSAIFLKMLSLTNISNLKQLEEALDHKIIKIIKRESKMRNKIKELLNTPKELDFTEIQFLSKANLVLDKLYMKFSKLNIPILNKYIQLRRSQSLSFIEVHKHLNATTCLLEFVLFEDILQIYIVQGGTQKNAPKLIEIKLDRNEIIRVVNNIRNDIDLFGRKKDFTYAKEYDLSYFFELGNKIFSKEVKQIIKNYEAIIIVPFGELHYLPIHAFKIDNRYLIETFAISYLPSSSILSYLEFHKKEPSEKKSIISLGVDTWDIYTYFTKESQDIFNLPFWNKQSSISLTNRKATKEKLHENIKHKDVIHLSSHGVFSKENPYESGLLLYCNELDEILHEHAKVKDFPNSFLTVKNIIEDWEVTAELVVVTGCVTGQTNCLTGDELIGFSRALLYSGGESMILSLFKTIKNVVVDEETHFNHFYTYWLQNGYTKKEAFKTYINKLIKHPKFSHPFFWFSYIYIGV